MNGQTTIYALADPNSGEVRYIGKTVKTLKQRLWGHASDSLRQRNHRNNWIRSLGTKPVIRQLMSVPNELGPAAEIYAIAIHRSMGYRLTNEASGGEGTLGVKCSPEKRAKISAANKGKTLSAEQRARISESLTGLKASPATRAKLSAALKGNTRACGNQVPPSVRAKISTTLKGRKLSDAHKEALRGKTRSMEHRARLSIANKGRTHTAETKAKISAVQKGKTIPAATRLKISAASKGRALTPEHVAKIAATNRAKTHCRQGHEFTPENTKPIGKGQRRCRMCERNWRQRFNATQPQGGV